MAGFDPSAFSEGAFDPGAFEFASGSLAEVPDVVGDAQATGEATLTGAGFVVEVHEAYSGVVPVGIIISQNPLAGSMANEGSTVTIVVSLGPAPASGNTTFGRGKMTIVIGIGNF